MEYEIECPNCNEVQNIGISFEGVSYQCICEECEVEFEVLKIGDKISVELSLD